VNKLQRNDTCNDGREIATERIAIQTQYLHNLFSYFREANIRFSNTKLAVKE
jgi:hypothetical protein